MKLEVFNMKTMKVREVEVVPSNMWGGQGLLGASVRFCSFRRASEHVWHVLDVEPASPAALAGLRPYTDYVVGSDQILQEPGVWNWLWVPAPDPHAALQPAQEATGCLAAWQSVI